MMPDLNGAVAAAGAAWLLTYLLHSTVLLGAAWGASRILRSEAWRETLWRAALLGGVLTASLQLGLGLTPVVGRYAISGDAAATPAPAVAAGLDVASGQGASTPSSVERLSDRRGEEAGSIEAAGEPTTHPAAAGEPRISAPPAWSPDAWAVALGGWAVIALVLLGRLLARQLRLHRLLRDREQVAEGDLPGTLAELRRNVAHWEPVWLTRSVRCPSPLALGMREICVPDRFLTELDREQQRAALAHELAHLARRDPAWHLVVGIVEALFFFQPLNRVARRELRAAAEHLCDDWAVRQTGSLDLARCLASVASWVAPGRDPIPAGTMAMAEGGSPLLQRVERILAGRGEPAGRSPFIRIAAALALLLTVVGVAPAITSAGGSPAVMAATHPAEVHDTLQVVRVPDATRPLVARWSWAEAAAAEAGERDFWIAYAAPGLFPDGDASVSDSSPWRMDELRGSPLAGRLGIGEEVRDIAAPGRSAALMLFRMRDAGSGPVRVERVSLRSPAAGMRLDGPVYWLGAVPAGESADWLWELHQSLYGTELSRTVVEALAVHDDARVPARLRRVIEDEGAGRARRAAVEGLEWHPADETLTLLRTLALEHPAEELRRQAAESLGKLDHPGAVGALEGLIRGGRGDVGMRRQAVESLAGRMGPDVAATMYGIAHSDPSVQVRREAVEALGRLGPELALPRLDALAWGNGAPEVQRQAVESLGGLATGAALAALERIAADHTREDVVREAVEAIAKFPRGVAVPRLERIARTHPLSSAREEALDQLSELVGSETNTH